MGYRSVIVPNCEFKTQVAIFYPTQEKKKNARVLWIPGNVNYISKLFDYGFINENKRSFFSMPKFIFRFINSYLLKIKIEV